MAYLDLLRRRYATKRFNGKKITDDQLAQLKEAIRLSPSSFNVQPWRVIVVEDQAMKEKLQPLSWNQEQITTCSHLFVFCVPTDAQRAFAELYALMERNGVEKKRLAGFKEMTQGSLAGKTPEQQVAWMRRQVYLALMSLMAAAADLGLDSCPMEGFEPEKYAEALGLTDTVPVTLCPVGFAADTQHPKVRLEPDRIFTTR